MSIPAAEPKRSEVGQGQGSGVVMSMLIQDIRYAVRSLRRGFLVTAFAIISLALAIAGNTAVFSLVNSILLRPLPYPDADRIVLVQDRRKEVSINSGQTLVTSLPALDDLEQRSRTLTNWAGFRPLTVSLRGSERPIPLTAAFVTEGFFPLTGGSVARGRMFTAEEMVEGGPRVVILTHEYWETTVGEGEELLGTVMRLNGEPYEVIGTLVPGFEFLTPGIDVWLPLTESPVSAPRDRRNLIAAGRMRDGVSMEEVRAEIGSLALDFETEYAETQRGWTMDAFNLRHDIPNSQSRQLFALLQGSVVFVLLIALANITNLLLARGQERQREIALRTVLGAGRGRIIRQLMTESLVLVLLGGVLGLALGAVGVRMIADAFAGLLPAIYTPGLDGVVLLFTLGLTMGAGILFGIMPAVTTFRRSQAAGLRSGGDRGSSAGGGRKTVSRILVVGEIALSLVALGGGSVLIRSFLELQNSDAGFDTSNILTQRFAGLESKYETEEQQAALFDEAMDRIRAVPGVTSASLVNALPQNFFAPVDSFRVVGATIEDGLPVPTVTTIHTTPEYLETLGVTLLQGRFIESADRLGQPPIAVVDGRFAREQFPNATALGQRIVVQGEEREIVGVAPEITQTILTQGGGPARGTVYLPIAQEPFRAAFAFVRADGDARAVAEPLRRALEAIDADMTITPALTLEEFTDQFFVGIKVFNAILGGFGLLALFLASLGTYGVLAYTVGQRTKEIGVRMAIGAEARDVVKMVSREGVRMALIGLGIGSLLLIPLTRVIGTLLQGLSEVHELTVVFVAVVLFGVTLMASVLPARRAALVDPVRALRQD